MPSRPNFRAACLLLGVTLATLLAGCAAPQPLIIPSAFVPGAIVARGVTGEARTSVPGAATETAIQNNGILRQVCTVRTGGDGAVALIFANAATLALQPSTEIVVETFTQIPSAQTIIPDGATEEPTSSVTKITLVRGQISGRVPKLHTVTGSSFVIHTAAGDKEFNGSAFSLP